MMYFIDLMRSKFSTVWYICKSELTIYHWSSIFEKKEFYLVLWTLFYVTRIKRLNVTFAGFSVSLKYKAFTTQARGFGRFINTYMLAACSPTTIWNRRHCHLVTLENKLWIVTLNSKCFKVLFGCVWSENVSWYMVTCGRRFA